MAPDDYPVSIQDLVIYKDSSDDFFLNKDVNVYSQSNIYFEVIWHACAKVKTQN